MMGTDKHINVSKLNADAKKMKDLIGLMAYPVGVKFLGPNTEIRGAVDAVSLKGHRYCQALMKARRGEHVLIDAEGISCPAAAAAFGFKPLPEGLATGKGLIGFGITTEESTGRLMFEKMPSFSQGEIKELYLFPLETATIKPDIVVIEDRVENLMWIALAYLNATGGERILSSTAILQAACVDSTIIPYKEGRMNISLGCYGCRDATDIGTDECVLGFPFEHFDWVTEFIAHLSQKAMPRSRGKNAYSFMHDNKGNIPDSDRKRGE